MTDVSAADAKVQTPDISSDTPGSTIAVGLGHDQSSEIVPNTSGGDGPTNNEEDPRVTILSSFSPRVSIHASSDTEELVRLKGIYGGFCGLLRPYGEKINGNVFIRDSIGSSKSWTDFGVQFVPFGTGNSYDPLTGSTNGTPKRGSAGPREGEWSQLFGRTSGLLPGVPSVVDQVVEHYLSQDEKKRAEQSSKPGDDHIERGMAPSIYTQYLRKLLSGRSMVPHETFTHPVACVIAISSQSTTPIDTLRDLYNDTRQEGRKLPAWIGGEFLRYYVLVHDEDNDDITQSTNLFSQMKRHFGLHCHLLRLRSIPCTSHEDDGTKLPSCRWLSAEEELSDISRKEQDLGIDELQQYLFDTDAAVLRTFVREMVTQSVVPFMEGRVTAWNDQVASRRRGISGRFMSLSKRWAGLGTNRSPRSASSFNSTATGSSYDASQEAYVSSSPEAVMHRLADYAFMLRDWKLSSGLYDILRSDFGDDKAWNHQAVANEMAAISLLLEDQSTAVRTKVETIDHMLDTASYSYITRCSNPQSAVRCLVVAVELYRSRGRTAVEEAAKWADRLLELTISSPSTQRILIERVAICYNSQTGTGLAGYGAMIRKSAFWTLLGSQGWLTLGKPFNARDRLNDAHLYYKMHGEVSSFIDDRELWARLRHNIMHEIQLSEHTARTLNNQTEDDLADVEQEELDTRPQAKKHHRLSLALSPNAIDLFQRLNDPLDQQNDGFR